MRATESSPGSQMREVDSVMHGDCFILQMSLVTPPRAWAEGRAGNIDTISEPTEIDLKQRAFNPLKIYELI